MGYTIVYDRAFIKTTRGIVPLVLCGSNNVWEPTGRGHERRERSWNLFYNKGMLELPADKLMEKVRELHPADGVEYFKRNGKWVDAAEAIKFFENGIKSACSLEEYSFVNHGVSLRAFISIWKKDTYGHRAEAECYIRTTDELGAWIDTAKAYQDAEDERSYISLHFSGLIEDTIKKSSKAHSGPVIAKNGNRYLWQYKTDSSVSFTPYVSEAIVFESAERAYAEIGRAFDYRLVSATVKEAHAKKVWILKVTEGTRTGQYIEKLRSNSSLSLTYKEEYAMGFLTQTAAMKYYNEKINGRFPSIESCEAVNKNEIS